MKRAIYIITNEQFTAEQIVAQMNGEDEDGLLPEMIQDLRFDYEDGPELEDGDVDIHAAIDSPLSDEELHEALCLWIYEGEDRPEFTIS